MPECQSSSRSPLAMLLALASAFALSQSFRTVTAVMALDLQHDFGLNKPALGAFAGLFGLSFGVAQLLMGIGMDVYGLRRTVLWAFPLAISGALLSALAPSYGWLMWGQLLIGVGCAPVFLSCTIFIARHFPSERFAYWSGIAMGLGGLGLLFTGTPLAWWVQQFGWRGGFALLALLSLLSWVLVWRTVHEPITSSVASGVAGPRESWGQAIGRMLQLFALPHTLGIMVLAMVCYSSFLSMRGLWLGPLLMQRHDFNLLQSGNVALGLSLIALFSPAIFGRLDPGNQKRRRWVFRCSLGVACFYAALAFSRHATGDIVLIAMIGILSGYGILQYADVRASYPPELIGRALSLYTMAMFLGVALIQWITGWVAAWAEMHQIEAYQAVMLSIASTLTLAAVAFRLLPVSPLLREKQT